jgi:hypothetical protein
MNDHQQQQQYLTRAQRRRALRHEQQCTEIILQLIIQVALTVPALHVSLLAGAVVYQHYPETGASRATALWMFLAAAVIIAAMGTGAVYYFRFKYPRIMTKVVIMLCLLIVWLPAAALGQWAGNESYAWAHPEPGDDRTFAVGMGLLVTLTLSIIVIALVIYYDRRSRQRYKQEEMIIRNSRSLTERSVSPLSLPPVVKSRESQISAVPTPAPAVVMNVKPSVPIARSFMTAGRIVDLEGE